MSSAQLVVKKENSSYSLPLNRNSIDLMVKTPGLRKRKTTKVTDLSLENLRAESALLKLVSFSQVVRASVTSLFIFYLLLFLMLFLFQVSDHAFADLKIRAEKAELALME